MQIDVLRNGGLAGVHERLGPVDTEDIDTGVRGQIEAKIDEIGFFDLPSDRPEDPAPDAFSYAITAVDGDRTHTVEFSDGVGFQHQNELHDLIKLLQETGATFVDIPRNQEVPGD